MKILPAILSACLCAAGATAIRAQTNEAPRAAGPATNAPAGGSFSGRTEIKSAYSEFDLGRREALYRGNVRVDRADVKLTCEWLKVAIPQSGGRLDSIVAETNVVIDYADEKGQKYHVTSARAIYECKVVNATTNETVTFTGGPRVTTGDSIIESEPMIWDRGANKFIFHSPRIVSTNTPAGGTNGHGLKLF